LQDPRHGPPGIPGVGTVMTLMVSSSQFVLPQPEAFERCIDLYTITRQQM